ncbi:MAG: GntR family transcriptional regulator [Thermovirgaceae bacterium]
MRTPNDFSTASEYVYRELRKRIFGKKLRAGQRLPEASIARELEVSRTPVREALRRLANEGLVDFVPNLGARLVFPTTEEVHDAYELREYLERLAIRKAAQRIRPPDLYRLEENIHEEEKAFAERKLDDYLRVNIAFHRIIAESSGNRMLAEFVGNVLSRIYVYMVLFESFFDFESNPSLEEHRQLLEALRQKDADLAENLIRTHVDLSRKALKNP